MLASSSLLLFWLLAPWLLVILFPCHCPLLWLPLLLLMVRVLVFTVITVVKMDMWRPSIIVTGKLKRLGLSLSFIGYWWY
jgi:hypothetical protein